MTGSDAAAGALSAADVRWRLLVSAAERAALFLAPVSWEVIENPAVDVRYSTTSAGDEAAARRPDDVAEPDWDAPSTS